MSCKFIFGGVKRDLRIELALAPKFEDAAGMGFLALTQAVTEKSAKLSAVIEVLRVAFEANGTKLSNEEIFDQIQHDKNGIVNAYAVAGFILLELCLRPESANAGKKSPPATRGRQNASH